MQHFQAFVNQMLSIGWILLQWKISADWIWSSGDNFDDDDDDGDDDDDDDDGGDDDGGGDDDDDDDDDDNDGDGDINSAQKSNKLFLYHEKIYLLEILALITCVDLPGFTWGNEMQTFNEELKS